MRVDDRPLPVVTLDDDNANSWTRTWPIRPVIAITQGVPYAWDDNVSVWDAGGDAYLWDIEQTIDDWIDATCDMVGCEITHGDPDDRLNFDAGSCTITLRNDSGLWSMYNVDGSPLNHGPGDLISVWATDGTSSWWLFSGRVYRWDELSDETIEIEAFDAFADLAMEIGTFLPGAANDHTPARCESILSLAGLDALPHRFASSGIVALTQQPTDQAPLEEMQTVMQSDGGVLFTDSDGTLLAYDRTWRAGRADQTTVPQFSHNVCSTPIVAWNTEISTNDVGLADTVILENIAKLQSRAALSGVRGSFVITETELQYSTQNEGDILAAFLLSQQQHTRLRVESFDLFLLDPDQPDLWRAVDWRLFDRVIFVHRARTSAGTTTVLSLNMLVYSISHSISAQNWIMSVGCSRALDYVAPVVWNTALYTWNDTSPLAVWSF